MGTATPQTVSPAAFGPVNPQRVLQLIGLNPNDPRAHAVVAVAQRYGLDPVLGHIEIIPRSAKPYITRDGYLHIAHRSGQFDGMEVVEGPRRESNEYVCRVAVFRKDMSHPFTYPGRCAVAQDNAQEMAIARAERRALRRAFAVTLPETFGDEDGAVPTPAPATAPPSQPSHEPPAENTPVPGPSATETHEPPRAGNSESLYQDAPLDGPLTNGQRRAIFAMFRQLGVPDDDREHRLEMLSTIAGHAVESTNELRTIEAAEVIVALGRLLDEQSADTTEGVDNASGLGRTAGRDDESGTTRGSAAIDGGSGGTNDASERVGQDS
jgi:hypothetical protein